MSRAERRRAAREARRNRVAEDPIVTFSEGYCQHPNLFGTQGCCICGASDVAKCPCDELRALAHLERAHPDADSALMREVIGCQITDSTGVPPGGKDAIHFGQFEAPCGSLVSYEMPSHLPTMAHYRWHGVYDHWARGACPSPAECESALRTGEV